MNMNLFQIDTSFKALKNLVYGTIAGVKVPFPLPQADACQNGIQCPVNQGTVNDETISLAILPEYPSVSVVVQFTVQDDSGKTVICALFPAKIQ
jgi:Niemann-Pick C2 protein